MQTTSRPKRQCTELARSRIQSILQWEALPESSRQVRAIADCLSAEIEHDRLRATVTRPVSLQTRDVPFPMHADEECYDSVASSDEESDDGSYESSFVVGDDVLEYDTDAFDEASSVAGGERGGDDDNQSCCDSVSSDSSTLSSETLESVELPFEEDPTAGLHSVRFAVGQANQPHTDVDTDQNLPGETGICEFLATDCEREKPSM